jgi:hypothetical protein
MIPQTGTILCVESEDAARESRCNALTMAGYTAVRASFKKAMTVLSESAFDLVVSSGLSDDEIARLKKLANGAELLSLDGDCLSTVLLFMVDERLRQLRSPRREVNTPIEQRAVKPRASFLTRFR